MSSIRQAVKLVANIVVNIVAFTAILIFVNAILLWLGHRVGMANLTFEVSTETRRKMPRAINTDVL